MPLSWNTLQPPWRPPSWWDMNTNVNDPSNRRLIKNAYAKAETCRECRNLSWPPEGLYLDPRNMEKLNASAQGGCAGCMVVRSIMTLIRYDIDRHDSRLEYNDRWGLKFEQSRIQVTAYSIYGRNCEVYSPHVQDHAWNIPHLPQELQVSSYSGSAHAIKRTQVWLRECKETHQSCSYSSSPLPSRVLLIRGPQQVELYESEGETVPYACLSYCWGKKHIIRTTKSTLPHHKQSISWKRLPLTFRQAISFTYRLGLKYLWIDSLCIIQDDVEDWRLEGSKMSQIYSGAYITLAATASRDASGGCFRRTPNRPLFRITYPDGKGSKSHLCIRPGMQDLGQSESHAPLLRRGWALQERLLSPRTLHFTHEELVWDCRTKRTCECSVQHYNGYNLYEFGPSWLSHSLSAAKDKVEPYVWGAVVGQYSYQRLTYEKDIFPALQGISKMFSAYIKSRYLAGLWETSLISDLLWYRCGKNAGLKEWRAPSWSWASILGPVTWGLRASPAYFHPLVTCMAVEVEPAGSDEFGEILAATITLRGRCFSPAMQQSWIHITDESATVYPKDPVWKALATWLEVDPDCRTSELDVKRSYSKTLEEGTCFKTLLIAKNLSRYGERCSYPCLVLRKCDGDSNTYERVGYMKIVVWEDVDESMFPLDEEETLCIV